jgi:hypothetical protein
LNSKGLAFSGPFLFSTCKLLQQTFLKFQRNVVGLHIPVFTNRFFNGNLSLKLPKGQSRRDDIKKANRIAFPKLVQ